MKGKQETKTQLDLVFDSPEDESVHRSGSAVVSAISHHRFGRCDTRGRRTTLGFVDSIAADVIESALMMDTED